MRTIEKLKISQNVWIENLPAELLITNDQITFLNDEKEKQAAELIVVNKELIAAEIEIKELNQYMEERVLKRTSELREANKALEAFSYFVAHDLRAPLRAVTSFAQIIQHEYGARMGPKLKELFGYIIDSVKRMNLIIGDLLKLATHGKEKLKLVPVDMTHLVKNAWSDISRDNPHNALLELSELPIMQADISMIEQAVINLLGNAIKYSSKKEKPVIMIWCEQTDKNVTFYFKDNGCGFNMNHSHRLFGAFQRLHGRSEYEGTGVGLMLVKSIIEKHGGTVGAKGIVDVGATFYFTLPYQRKILN